MTFLCPKPHQSRVGLNALIFGFYQSMPKGHVKRFSMQRQSTSKASEAVSFGRGVIVKQIFPWLSGVLVKVGGGGRGAFVGEELCTVQGSNTDNICTAAAIAPVY